MICYKSGKSYFGTIVYVYKMRALVSVAFITLKSFCTLRYYELVDRLRMSGSHEEWRVFFFFFCAD